MADNIALSALTYESVPIVLGIDHVTVKYFLLFWAVMSQDSVLTICLTSGLYFSNFRLLHL